LATEAVIKEKRTGGQPPCCSTGWHIAACRRARTSGRGRTRLGNRADCSLHRMSVDDCQFDRPIELTRGADREAGRTDRPPVGLDGCVRVFQLDVLVAHECPGWEVVAVQLQCPTEVLDRLWVLSSRRVEVAWSRPGANVSSGRRERRPASSGFEGPRVDLPISVQVSARLRSMLLYSLASWASFDVLGMT
jgi:hypothetical protein